MVIGVDAGALCVEDDRLKVGVYRVTRQAVLALAQLDKINRYRLYTFQPIEQGIIEQFDGRATIVQLPRRGWHRIFLPLELRKRPVNAFLGLSQSLPSTATLCDIGFVYDLGFLYRPDVYEGAANSLRKQTETLIRRADHVITISHATKSDIISYYSDMKAGSRVKPGMTKWNKMVSVAYPGVGSAFSPAGDVYVAKRPYVLFVGSLNKAKDISTLLAMVARTAYDLYLIGGDYWPDPDIDETIVRLHLGDRIRKFGVVADEELPKYYRGATAFVTAAIREGFCLSAAEAMACGTPVVALDRGALREVVGEGGIIKSERPKVKSVKLEFAKALNTMTVEKTRALYSKKAIAQAKKFRWEKFGEHIMSCVKQRLDPRLRGDDRLG